MTAVFVLLIETIHSLDQLLMMFKVVVVCTLWTTCPVVVYSAAVHTVRSYMHGVLWRYGR